MTTRLKGTGEALKHALAIGLWSFLLAALASLAAQTLVEGLAFVSIAFALLLLVILVGIGFDVIGVAAAAAQQPPLHARAANRVPGARHAVRLVKNAHRVASVCNDLVGDVCGTLGGAIGITIVLELLNNPSGRARLWSTVLMTAAVAALVVGGKAFAKSYAINQATTIIFSVGRLLAWTEKVTHLNLTPRSGRRRRHAPRRTTGGRANRRRA